MKRKRVRQSATAVALVVIALGTGAMEASGGQRGERSLKFTLYGEVDDASFVDNGPAGDSAGDVFVFQQAIRREREGSQIGSDRASCTRTTRDEQEYLCSGVFLLPRGQITIQGIEPPPGVNRHPLIVTGGSGRYRGVSGVIRVTHLSPTEDRFEFRLRR